MLLPVAVIVTPPLLVDIAAVVTGALFVNNEEIPDNVEIVTLPTLPFVTLRVTFPAVDDVEAVCK